MCATCCNSQTTRIPKLEYSQSSSSSTVYTTATSTHISISRPGTPAYRAALTTASTSIALSLAKGRGMSRSSITGAPLKMTTKAPLRGFSPPFTTTLNPASLRTFSTLADRPLNTPQLLQCSIDANFSEEAFEDDAEEEAFFDTEGAAAFATLGAMILRALCYAAYTAHASVVFDHAARPPRDLLHARDDDGPNPAWTSCSARQEKNDGTVRCGL